jgi:hypothetical protein
MSSALSVALSAAVYLAIPLGLLWLAVRVVRHAWLGRKPKPLSAAKHEAAMQGFARRQKDIMDASHVLGAEAAAAQYLALKQDLAVYLLAQGVQNTPEEASAGASFLIDNWFATYRAITAERAKEKAPES